MGSTCLAGKSKGWLLQGTIESNFLAGSYYEEISPAFLRLVYQQAEINLLDDPLAALDAEVGQAVFHQVIGSSGK